MNSIRQLDEWSERNKLSLLLMLSGMAFVIWFSIYLTVPYPAIFGDEFSTYALTRAVADPLYNLKDDAWVYNMRGSMYVFSSVYQLVQLREGNPLIVAQFLNAICIAGTIPLVWGVARQFMNTAASFGLSLLYISAAMHTFGAHFILEPLFYLGFWAAILATLLAICGPASWALVTGALCCILCFIKPHGMVTTGWSFLLLIVSIFISDTSLKTRCLRVTYWLLGFVALQITFRWLSAGASADTVKGGGFYGSVFHEFSQPAVFFKYLQIALSSLVVHTGFYALVYNFVAALAIVALIEAILFRKWKRQIEGKDLFALSLPILCVALLCMALAYSSFVQETYRIHARYWSYALIPALIGGLHFTNRPLGASSTISRLVPLCIVSYAIWFIFLGRPDNLQVFVNDCPEIQWLYLGASRLVWHHILIIIISVLSGAIAVLYVFKQRAGLVAAVAMMGASGIIAGYLGMDFLRHHSIANGVQTRLSTVLQSYRNEILTNSLLVVTPQSYMAGGALFGLPRIPTVLLKPTGSTLSSSDVPDTFKVICTVGAFIPPSGFVKAWTEGGYSVYVKQ